SGMVESVKDRFEKFVQENFPVWYQTNIVDAKVDMFIKAEGNDIVEATWRLNDKLVKGKGGSKYNSLKEEFNAFLDEILVNENTFTDADFSKYETIEKAIDYVGGQRRTVSPVRKMIKLDDVENLDKLKRLDSVYENLAVKADDL